VGAVPRAPLALAPWTPRPVTGLDGLPNCPEHYEDEPDERDRKKNHAARLPARPFGGRHLPPKRAARSSPLLLLELERSRLVDRVEHSVRNDDVAVRIGKERRICGVTSWSFVASHPHPLNHTSSMKKARDLRAFHRGAEI
jgi:hypothetical protein